MTIDELGFLSPDLQGWIKKYRSENPAWFALADRLNQIGQQCITQMVVSDNHQKFLSALLFMRGVSNYQGAILLTERGMTLEGRILTRSCFETLFFLGALKNKPEFVQDFIGDDASRRKKMAKRLKNIPDELSGISQEHIKMLDQFLAGLIEQSDIEIKDLLIKEAARIAGASADYDTIYLGLSNDSSHPSMVSLNRYVTTDEAKEITGLYWGPNVSDVEDTLFNACAAALQLIIKIRDILGINDKNEKLEQCIEDYKKLVGEKTAKIDAEFNQLVLSSTQ